MLIILILIITYMINIKHININMLNINHYMYDLSQIIWPNKNDYDNVDDHLKAFNDSFLYVINSILMPQLFFFI